MAFSLVYHSACENIKADVTKWANKNVENQIRFELRTVTNKSAHFEGVSCRKEKI